jgi:Predicted pyridoxal phosphate-dependent enzyme apparently involved in regulation of cell wall biogenesis
VSSSERLSRIPLAEPTLGGNAGRYLAECLASNYVSSIGPFVERFEREFATAVGSRYAVACASGTAALHLAMRVLDLGPGDEVFVPTLTFIASANPIRYERATPVLVDVEEETLNLDAGIVADELDRRARLGLRLPKAIEVVHLLGHPANLAPLLAAAERHGVPVIEDASEALGATYIGGPFAGRSVGSIGRLGCYSFNGNKLITTGGGGMVTTDDEALARRARHLSTQARLPGRAYDHDQIGYNYRLSNLAAALGVSQLEQLPDLLAARRGVAARYDAAIVGLSALRPAARGQWADPSFWLYTARLAVPDVDERDRVLDILASEAIDARPIWTPIHTLALYADAPRLGGAVAERVFAAAISLPSSSSLGLADQDRVVAALRFAFA